MSDTTQQGLVQQGAIRPRKVSVAPRPLPDPALREMQHYGFIYADGSYSHERQMRGAMLVPRRPSPQHFWDPESKEWYLDGDVMPPGQGNTTESIQGSENPGPAPTQEQVMAAAGVGEPSASALVGTPPALADLMKGTATPAEKDATEF